jgi:hypothetical protein
LTAEHDELMAQDQQLDVFRELAAPVPDKQAKNSREGEIGEGKEHRRMLPKLRACDGETRNLGFETPQANLGFRHAHVAPTYLSRGRHVEQAVVSYGPYVPIVGKKLIPEGVITTRRIEIVSKGVSGRPRADAAAVKIVLFTRLATTGVTAARSRGSTTDINRPPAIAPRGLTDPITPGVGTTSQTVVATAVMSRVGTRVKLYAYVRGKAPRARPVMVIVIVPLPRVGATEVMVKPETGGIPADVTAAEMVAAVTGVGPGITMVIAPVGFPGEPAGNVVDGFERKSEPVDVAFGASSMLIAIGTPPGSVGPWTNVSFPPCTALCSIANGGPPVRRHRVPSSG